MKRIVPDVMSLKLVRDAEDYVKKQFVLSIWDGDGNQIEIEMDGIQVADIAAAGVTAGIPFASIPWLKTDG